MSCCWYFKTLEEFSSRTYALGKTKKGVLVFVFALDNGADPFNFRGAFLENISYEVNQKICVCVCVSQWWQMYVGLPGVQSSWAQIVQFTHLIHFY